MSTKDGHVEGGHAEEEPIDHEVFDSLLEMDDDDDHTFSAGIVQDYLEQVEVTFKKMDEAFKDKKLVELSNLGHFLKGSSAALGVTKVRLSCEKIQHHGNLKDEKGEKAVTEDEALDKIRDLLANVKEEFKEADNYFAKRYKNTEKEKEKEKEKE